MTAPFASYIHEYHHAIQTGKDSKGHKVHVGQWVAMLYDKVVRELQDGLYYFNSKKADKAIKFIENFCHHCEGRSDLFKLELWQ